MVRSVAGPRIAVLAKALETSVTTVPGSTKLELRRQIFERAASKVRGERGPALPDIEAVVDSVALEPYRAEVVELLDKGLSEDAVFEIIVTAAVGAGYAQVEKALAALETVKK